jgi:GT2 family glycosyltransferase
MGGFRENFAHYGYEDIDLGYRLYCAGAIFDLCQSSVIHQNDISNFAKRYLLRFKNRMALSRSARVFFEGNLQNDVYLHCRYLFRPFLAFWFLAEDIYHLFSPRRRA